MTATSRREAIRGAALAGAALTVPALVRPGLARAQSEDTEELEDFVEGAIELEQNAVLAYETVAEANGIDAELRRTLELFRDQEDAQAAALRSAFELLSSDDPPDAPTQTDEVDELRPLARLRDRDELLEFLVGLEEDQLRYYRDEAPELESVDMVTTAAEIAACQAQHLAVLREALGSTPAEAVREPLVRDGGGAAAGDSE